MSAVEPIWMPEKIYKILLDGFCRYDAAGEGDWHPSNDFGAVFRWVWRHRRSDAAKFIAEYIGQVRQPGVTVMGFFESLRRVLDDDVEAEVEVFFRDDVAPLVVYHR